MTTESRLTAFLFSVQRALPNELPSALTGVAIDVDEKTLYIRCFFRGPIAAAEQEFLTYLQDAVWADYFPTMRVEAEGLEAALADVLPNAAWAWRTTAIREMAHA